MTRSLLQDQIHAGVFYGQVSPAGSGPRWSVLLPGLSCRTRSTLECTMARSRLQDQVHAGVFYGQVSPAGQGPIWRVLWPGVSCRTRSTLECSMARYLLQDQVHVGVFYGKVSPAGPGPLLSVLWLGLSCRTRSTLECSMAWSLYGQVSLCPGPLYGQVNSMARSTLECSMARFPAGLATSNISHYSLCSPGRPSSNTRYHTRIYRKAEMRGGLRRGSGQQDKARQ